MWRLFYSSKEIFERCSYGFELNRKRIPWVQLIIAFLGLTSSLWTYLLHIQVKTQVGIPLICDVSETINCSKIIGSAQGEFLNIPLGIWGMVYWLIVLGLVFLPKYSRASLKYIATWRLFVSGTGFISALALAYISYFVLKGICEFCSVVQASCMIYFIASLISYIKVKKRKHIATKKDFIKMVSTVVIALVLPLIVFASTKTLLHNYYKKTSPKTVQKQQPDNSKIKIPYLPILDNENIDYYQGSDDALIEIVVFTDFECPYCQLLHEKLQGLKRFVDSGKVKIYFRNWALSYHKYATKLAIAARCAGNQGKFWEFADWAFLTAKTYGRNKKQKDKMFSDSNIKKKIQSLTLHTVIFNKCIQHPRVLKKLNKDSADAIALGGSGTPFLLINGSSYKGNWLQDDSLKKYIAKTLDNLSK